MNTERNLGENERHPICPWHLPVEDQPQQVLKVNPFPDGKDGIEQDQNMEPLSCTNQPFLEGLDPQDIEVENDPVENDSELAAIAAQLRETASYAINPTFKEELRKKLLQQFREHCTGETNG